MGFSVKAIALTTALLWGGCMLLVGLIHLADPSYGGPFLGMMSSVYPGADTARTLSKVLLGAVYGFVDGAVGGYVFALLYKAFAQPHYLSPLSVGLRAKMNGAETIVD